MKRVSSEPQGITQDRVIFYRAGTLLCHSSTELLWLRVIPTTSPTAVIEQPNKHSGGVVHIAVDNVASIDTDARGYQFQFASATGFPAFLAIPHLCAQEANGDPSDLPRKQLGGLETHEADC